ncbi:DUF5677 domain-containing protein [Longimicrobium sp.]|uniref:DUF5677 domain-containing protein n=1 Tax=Longimicrobium sp. TaxID=2029185 RepID=UPI002B533C8F|nr:DUF5677 domain-containing protein [Longimicrobium sp.]HSU16819.1 DUF5677 domain-containing protein [Longimicrobium sp.]
MRLQAHPLVLDAAQSAKDVERYFGASLDVLRELIDFATNLEIRIHSMGVGDTDRVVGVGVLYHRNVALMDAAELLLRSGQVYGARLQARALLEASWNLEWMLNADVHRRACQFYVLDLRKRIAEPERFIPGTASNDELKSVISAANVFDKERILAISEEEIAGARQNIAEIRQRIREVPDFQFVNAEIDRQKKLAGLKWFQLFGGPNDHRNLAKRLGYESEYEIFYRLDSNAVHGTWVQDHISIRNDIARSVPIRGLRDFGRVADVVWNAAFRSTKQVIDHFRPGEMLTFLRQFMPGGNSRWDPPIVESEIEAVVPYG